MTHTRNTTGDERPDWIRMWVGCAIFIGVSAFIYDTLNSLAGSRGTAGAGTQALVYTSLLFTAISLVRALMSRRNIKRATFTFIAVCTIGCTAIHLADVLSGQTEHNGIAQTQDQL